MESHSETETDWVDDAVAGLPALVTVNEAITLLRMSRRGFYRLLSGGIIRSTLVGRKHLIHRGELVRYLRSHDVKAGRAA